MSTVERVFHVQPLRRVAVEIRPAAGDDWPYIRATWRATHHRAPGKRRMTWAEYKKIHGAMIDRLCCREDVYMYAAYDAANKIHGWIAWTPGRVPTLHYVYVRREEQRTGLALRLIREAGLGSSFVYTHKGLKPKHAPSMDAVMVEALAKRGVTAAYVPIAQWMG